MAGIYTDGINAMSIYKNIRDGYTIAKHLNKQNEEDVFQDVQESFGKSFIHPIIIRNGTTGQEITNSKIKRAIHIG